MAFLAKVQPGELTLECLKRDDEMTLWLRLAILSTAIFGMMILPEQTAQADVYSDPTGFSFTYPEGWFPIPKSDQGQLTNVLPPELKDWLSKNNTDLSMISVMVVRAGEGEFLENVNVATQPGQVPVAVSSVGEVASSITQQFQKAGARIDNMNAVVRQVASRDVYVIDYVLTLPGSGAPVRQRQFIIPGGGKTVFVTCSSTPDAFAAYEPAFEQMLSSFQAPAVIKKSVSGGALIGGLGGFVGGLIALLAGMSKRFSRGAKSS
jgi:hypothetical protein